MISEITGENDNSLSAVFSQADFPFECIWSWKHFILPFRVKKTLFRLQNSLFLTLHIVFKFL